MPTTFQLEPGNEQFAMYRRRSISAVSDEARVVRNTSHSLAAFMEQSFELFGRKAEAISQLRQLASECAEGNWDANDAAPVSRDAINLAEEFIRALPNNVPLPEFAPEPDGAVSLDWVQSRHRLFSLSIGTSRRLAYAWLDGSDKGHAVASFYGETIPPSILEGIGRIMRLGSIAIRVA